MNFRKNHEIFQIEKQAKTQCEQVFFSPIFTSCYETKTLVTNCHCIFTYEIFLDVKVCKVDKQTTKNIFYKGETT